MGCGLNATKEITPRRIQPTLVLVNQKPDPANPLAVIQKYDTWISIFDYFNIRDLARVSQVCKYGFR